MARLQLTGLGKMYGDVRAVAGVDLDIRQATLVGAEILRMPDKLGMVKPGAFADILVVDGDPIRKLELLAGQGEHLSVIMKAGRFHKNTLAA